MSSGYESKRTAAKHAYVVEKKTAKEIAETLGIAQKTVGEWVRKYGWREERNAKATATEKRAENVEKIINGLAEKRIELERKIEEEEAAPKPNLRQIEAWRREISGVDYAVANWNKSLATIQKESKIPLSQYLQVMTDVFQSLAQFDYALYMKTIDFQEQHINDITNRQ